MIIVLALDDRWICIEPQGACVVKPYTPLRKPCFIVWLPTHSTGEMTLQGEKSHAAALIERRELAKGSIDLESRVFVHNVYPVDSAYQAAYSIAPLSRWQEISGWAGNQTNHCILSNATALAWSVIRIGRAVVIQDGLTFTFWAIVRNRIVHTSLVAMGPGSEDTRFAAAALGQRIHAALSADGKLNSADDLPILNVKWLSVMRKHDELEHASALQAFKEAAMLDVESADLPYDTCSDLGIVASALPSLAQQCPAESIIGPPGGRFLLRAEKWLPVCSLLSLIVSVSFVGLAVYWLAQASQIKQGSQEQRAELAGKSSTLFEPARKQPQNIEFDAQLSFITSIRQLQDGYDVVHALQALKLSVHGGMRILGVRSASDADAKTVNKSARAAQATPRVFIVDGVLPDSSSQDVLLLSKFIHSLNNSGYTAEAIDVVSSAAASSTSIRLFSYRVFPSDTR